MENHQVHTRYVQFVFGKMTAFNFYDYDFVGGANTPSLRQAQKNFIIFGACEERCIAFVRKPNEKDEKDSNWKPFV